MKCWDCGKENATISYEGTVFFDEENERERLKTQYILEDANDYPSARWFCNECYRKRNEDLKRKREQYGILKKQLMFERAVKMFEKQAVNIYDYKDIIDDMAEYITERPEKFDSAHEMVAAMILVENGISAKVQHKVGSYRVDFYVPSYKIVLEIDGELHRNNLYRDNVRDTKVREILGDDWETVRIGTKYIETNAKALVDAMIAIRDEKKKLRAKHNGYLPDWYSDRNKAKRTRLAKAGDDHLFGI